MIQAGNVTVMVRDLDRAIRFYTETLGLKLNVRAGDHWAEIATPGLTIGLHPWTVGHGPEPGKGGGISIGLLTDPIERAVETLRAKGVTFHGPIQDNENVKLAFFADPDGNALYLCEVKPAPAYGRGPEGGATAIG